MPESDLIILTIFIFVPDAIAVQSNVTHDQLRVTLKKPGPLWIRIPSWADRGEIQVEDGRFIGSHLFIADRRIGDPIVLGYQLPTREIVLRHRTREIRVRLKGDSVVAMDNFGADLTFFDPISE